MDINPIDMAIHIINIVVLYILLRLILYKPISRFLNKRAEGIQRDIDGAVAAKAEAEGLKASYEAHLQNAEQEGKKAALDITQRADLAAADIVDLAKTDAANIVQAAHDKAEAERRESLAALKGQIADISIELAGEILGREITAADNQKAIDAFFTKER